MSFEASAKSIRLSPRKIRLVIDQVRGLSVDQAEKLLRFTKKKGAIPVLKVIQSAAANALNTAQVEKSNLQVSAIHADAGFVMKRFRARAFGRAVTVRKRTSHVHVVLGEIKPAVTKAAKKSLTGTSAVEKKNVAPKQEVSKNKIPVNSEKS